MSEKSTPFHAIIIGAGPAGLLTAQALKKQGIHCTVFEQDASLADRPRDWNFGIYWAQVPLDECLPNDLSSLIDSAQVDSRTPAADDFMPLYNGQSGELMKKLPAPYNIRLHRRKFLKLISTGIDIRYGKRLEDIESDGTLATAIFEDGTREVGNLLIGAEGAHSKVRNFLLGPERAALKMSPLVSTGTIAKLPAETALQFKNLHQRYLIAFHPNGYFVWLGVHEAYDHLKPGEWTFMILHSWASEEDLLKGPKILEDLKERGKLYGEPFNEIFQSIPEDTLCWHGRLSYWPTEAWDNHNGTVTLVGDAAHPMTFHRGQGLNNAIHDAGTLAQELKKQGIGLQSAVITALTAYEQEMWRRGKEAVMSSNENSLSIHNWSTLLNSPLFTVGLKQKTVPQDSKPDE